MSQIGTTPSLSKKHKMIDFKDVLANPEKYAPKKISEMAQEIKVGDKVRCYTQDLNDLSFFEGYGTVVEYLGQGRASCRIKKERRTDHGVYHVTKTQH